MAMTADQIALTRQKLVDQGTSAVQSIQIENATGGTFTLSLDGQTTSAIASNAGANVVQNALCALSNVGVGNATVNDSVGVPNSTFYTISFVGELGNAAQPMLTVNSSLTGTGVIIDVQQVTAGGVTAFSDDELNGNYTLANNNFFLGIAYGFHDLWANSARFNDYTAGQTSEKKSQVTQSLKDLWLDYYTLSRAGQQVLFASMVAEPPRPRAIPNQVGIPSTSLTVIAGNRRDRWRGGW